jgi:hypothetical protein
MEILFRNKRGTAKLCMRASTENIWDIPEAEVNRLNDILSLNEGYTWIPVRTGFAKDNKLPLI